MRVWLPARNKMRVWIGSSNRRTCVFTWRLLRTIGLPVAVWSGSSRRASRDYASVRNWRSRFRENVSLVVTLIVKWWKLPSFIYATMIMKTENGGMPACWLQLAAIREPLFQWGKQQSTSFLGSIHPDRPTRSTCWNAPELRRAEI